MQDYEERQQAKKKRYEQKAEQLRAEASSLHKKAHEMAQAIPFGQPILVGHYSESRDRRYRARIHDTFGKAFAASEKADYYEHKAETMGTGSISSDDPKAVEKLKAKLAELEKLQEMMKQANALIRKHKTPETQTAALLEMGFSEAEAHELLKPSWSNRQGFMPFQLQNNNANIRRIRQRIAVLEKAAKENVTREASGNSYILREDAAENRVMFIFDGKPEPEIRSLLKSFGFKWSPSRGAWVRMLNGNGRYAARQVREKLEG